VTSGATARNLGKYFEFNHDSDDQHWKPLKNVDIKFAIYACAFNGDTTATTTIDTYVLPANGVEHIHYNRYHPKTLNRLNLKIGERIFQETLVIYGTVSVNNQSTIITCTNNINFSILFPTPASQSSTVLGLDPVLGQTQYIVLRNGSTQAANVDVVRVQSVLSNTQLQLTRLPVFTNNTATFSVTAAGDLNNHDRAFHTGRRWDYTTNTFTRDVAFKTDAVQIINSNANSTVRFTNNNLETISITSGGTGYSNSDIITVHPILDANTADITNIAYIDGYANAIANVVTNGAGTITGISVTDAGWGMCSNVAVSITTTAGNGANIAVSIGSTLRGAESNATISDLNVTAIPVHTSYPTIRYQQNQNHTVQVVQHLPFHVYPGTEHLIQQANTSAKTLIQSFRNTRIQDIFNNDSRIQVLPSHSILQKKAANVTITLANNATHVTQVKSPSIIEMPVTSNNVYTMPTVSTAQVYNYTYVINNDITGETKGHGNAQCRHISEKVTFAENRNAEDVMVYCDIYKPAGTDVHAFVRIHAMEDQEAFDDKDWTLLELKSNNESYSSSLTDENDIAEFAFGLPSVPASVNTIAGYVTTTSSSANLVGVGTAWSTDLKVNDVIKIYSDLFPENYMVSVVRTIANNTFVTIDDAVTDIDIYSASCKIDLIGRPTDGVNPEIGNPFQAFIYAPNSSVCRYYDAAMSKHDAYNTFQLKLVLTSNNNAIVPKVWNTRAVGVSA
jgi:hypothetical protein